MTTTAGGTDRARTTNGLHILLVDDDREFTDLVVQFLTREMDDVTTVTETDAQVGLDRLADEAFDAVVSDYDMPGMDGLSFLEAVREKWPDLPFVLFTGSGSEEIASEAISAGVTDYLRKGTTDQYALLANRLENAVARRRAEHAVQEREERLGRLLDGSMDIITVIDSFGVVQYSSPSVERILGYEPDAHVGENVFDYIHPDDRESVMETYFDAVENPDQIPTAEYRFRHADGSWRWLASRGSDRLERPDLTGFIVNARDVTERKERERELERYETMVETARDGFYTLDADGRFTDVNEFIVERTGYSRDKLLGSHVSLVLDEEDIEQGLAAIKTLLSSDDTLDTSFEETIHTADGDSFPAETHIGLLTDEDGAFRGTVGVVRDITERKKHEEELERYQMMVETAQDGMYTLDSDGVFTQVNEYIVENTGYSRDELVGSHVSILLDEEGIENGVAAIKELLSREDAPLAVFDATIHPADSDPYPAEGRIALLTDEDGAFRGTLGVIRDMSEREKREEELERYETIIETVPDSIYTLDADGRFTWVNEHVIERTGYSREEFLGSPVTLVLDEGDIEQARGAIERLLASEDEHIATFEQTTKTADGGAFMTENRIALLTDEDGAFAGTVGIVRDIADRKRREQELERYETMVETVSDGVYALDEEGRYTFVNSYIEELSGFDREDILGEPATRFLDEGYVDQLEAAVREMLAGERDLAVHELESRTADGSTVPIESRITLLPHEGAFRGTVGVSRDITERKERERELRRQRTELERQNERLESFASVVSHDLRNPLNVAQGYLDLGLETGDSASFERVEDALDRMDELIEDVLALAREGAVVSGPKSVALESVVDSVTATTDLGSARLVVGELPTVEGDEERLCALFENLFRNALDHGRPDSTITVGRVPHGDGFFVEDDGPGIPPDERERVFDVGYTTSREGTGLGLNIVREIAEAHGWTVAACDGEGGGARFEFVTGDSA